MNRHTLKTANMFLNLTIGARVHNTALTQLHATQLEGINHGPQIRIPRVEKHFIRGNSALKLHLKGFFTVFPDFIPAHAQKHHLFYFRFQNRPKFGLLVPKNIYTHVKLGP